MNFDNLLYLKEMGAVIDDEKKRVELEIKTPDGDKSKIVGYFPSDSIQVIVYDIHSKEIPDLGLDFKGEGRFLRVDFCKNGRCEFKSREGKSAYISAGEISMDFYIDNAGTFSFAADNYIGVEIIMQVDKVIKEIPTLAMLKKAIKRMDLPEYATSINSLYFIDASNDTKRTLDELLRYCFENYDCEAIIIKTAELGHNIGTDLSDSKAKLRTFTAHSQAIIAESIYRKLTDDYGTKWTAAVFAEKYGVSESSIKNYFRNVYGYGFKEYQIKVRMERAAELLVNTNLNIKEVAEKVGYMSRAKFGDTFKNYHGISAAEYRRNAKAEKISSELANE